MPRVHEVKRLTESLELECSVVSHHAGAVNLTKDTILNHFFLKFLRSFGAKPWFKIHVDL